MATHQAIGGITDDELLQRMVASHRNRYSEAFWEFFEARIGVQLPEQPFMIDIGCGPGLFLRDLSVRYPRATLHGYDVTPAMIQFAEEIEYASPHPTLAVHDLSSQPLPLETGTVQLVCMTAVLHVLDDPLPALAEVRRVLASW
jgi:trans-aconitate methyltransferase